MKNYHMTTIDEILADLDNKELWDVLNIVYAHYLTPKEQEHYQVLLLHMQGKPQRDLGILLNVQQYKVSEYLSKLQKKLKRITTVLMYQRPKLESLLKYLKPRLTEKQWLIIGLLLAGHKRHQVAKLLNCSPASISFRLDQVPKRLSVTKNALLDKFLSILN